jgi:hypothetical protein
VILPRPGQPGHGRTARLRRQSVWIAHERKSRRTGAFELICGDCGDHPYLEYSDLPSRLQQIRGPYTREAGLAAYVEHLGLAPQLHEPGLAGAALVRQVISPGDPGIATGTQPAARLAVRVPRTPHGPRDPWLRIAAEGAMTLPLASQPGHGRTATLRRQPVRIVDGRMEGGYTDAFELICPSCGDHPYLDYSEVSPRLQQIRGPYTLEAGLAAYTGHLGADSAAPRGQQQAADPSNGETGNSASHGSPS